MFVIHIFGWLSRVQLLGDHLFLTLHVISLKTLDIRFLIKHFILINSSANSYVTVLEEDAYTSNSSPTCRLTASANSFSTVLSRHVCFNNMDTIYFKISIKISLLEDIKSSCFADP